MYSTTAVPRPDGQMPVYRYAPESPRAGIVLVQEIFGVSTYVRDRAEDLAQAGYLVDIPELYFRHDEPVVADDDPNLLTKGMGLMANTPWEQAVDDVLSAVERLAQELGPDTPVILVGFCYGGGLAYAATAKAEEQGDSPISALVSYYGSALPTLLDLEVTAPSLHHFGTADQFIPMPEVEKIRTHVERSGAEFHLYDGADHAFDNTLPVFHHAQAASLAWQRTLDFLAAHAK